MKLRWDKWLYGLGSAFLGGGASAVVSGITSMAAFHVDVTTWAGALKIMSVTGINFVITGAFSMFFYLKQEPLPQSADNTVTIKKSDVTPP